MRREYAHSQDYKETACSQKAGGHAEKGLKSIHQAQGHGQKKGVENGGEMPFIMLTALTAKVWDRALDFAPFFLLTKNGVNKIELNLNRIIEAVLIAALTGALVGWSVKSDIENVKKDVSEVKAQVSKIYSDIYRPEIRSVQ